MRVGAGVAWLLAGVAGGAVGMLMGGIEGFGAGAG